VKFLVDNQLPAALSRRLVELGHHSEHVAELGLDLSHDAEIWRRVSRDQSVLVTKDEDFVFLANRPGDTGCLIWVRMGNCRKGPLLDAFERSLPTLEAAFSAGQRIVEIVGP